MATGLNHHPKEYGIVKSTRQQRRKSAQQDGDDDCNQITIQQSFSLRCGVDHL